MENFNFSTRLLDWFEHHGRKDLPWQIDASPYHVWLSEIMLQQTQVSTVMGYYQKFIKRFPDVHTLAEAPLDDVLAHWAGLGYYARARNLHKAAQEIVTVYNGNLPADLVQLMSLPGIGRSTAGAIMTLAYKQRHPILDGNVKRVLARFDAIDSWPGQKDTEKQLWQRAESLLPEKNIDQYIQAQMDLGATLCTRSRPDCQRCPLQDACKAYLAGTPTDYPKPNPKRKKQAEKSANWLVLLNEKNEVYLQQRPNSGIWGGLWSFPEIENPTFIETELMQYNVKSSYIRALEPFTHVFTHFKLRVSPYLVSCAQINIKDIPHGHWYKIEESFELGLPAPVKSVLVSIIKR